MKKILLSSLGALLLNSLTAQLSISTTPYTYQQNFNSLSPTGSNNAFSSLPTHWMAQENGSNADTEYRASYGEFAGGDIYSYGDTNSTERALGSVGSGSNTRLLYGLPIINQSNDTISSIFIEYMGEQWRQGRPGSARSTGPDTLFFEYSLSANALEHSSFQAFPSLNFASPQNNGALNTPLNGNNPANRSWISDSISGINLAPGDSIFIRWRDFNSSSYDDGLAIDSLSITFYAKPSLSGPGFLSINQSGQSYYQSFDQLENSYTAAYADFTTLPYGWFAHEQGSNANTTYRVSMGEFAGGEIYSYGDSASTDRALGSVGSGSNSSLLYGAAWINHTNDSIRSIRIRYTGEQWRQGRPGSARSTGPDTLSFAYSTDAQSIDQGNYLSVSALDFPSPQNNAALNTPLNGNLPQNQSKIEYYLENVKAGPNDTIWIRWRDFNSSSYDDGLAIDSLLVTFYDTSSTTKPGKVYSHFRSISNFNTLYTENFDSLPGDYLSPVHPYSSLPKGWFAHESGTNSDQTFKASYGEFGGGNIYSFGDSLSSERALGSIGSGTNNRNEYGSAWINSTGDTIRTLEIKYTGEQWRQGRPGRTTGPDTLHFSFGINRKQINSGGYTNLPNLNFFSPVSNGVLNSPLDGNLVANRTKLHYVMVNLNIAPNDTIWLKWTDYNSDSYDDGLAIDSFSIAALDNHMATSISFVNRQQHILETDGIVNIPLQLNNPNSFSSQVEVYIADPGSCSAKDFNYASSTTIFQSGDTTAAFSLSLNRNEPFENTEYLVLGLRNLGNATMGDVVYDTLHIHNYDYPLTAIASIKSVNSNGVADSLDGRYAIEGIVHGINYSQSGGLDFYLMDNNSGINIYAAAGSTQYVVKEGDKLKIWGQLSQFRGLTRLEAIDSIAVLSSNNSLNTAQAVSTLNENTESKLLKLENVRLSPAITHFPYDQNVSVVTSAKDTLEVFISSKTDLAGISAPITPFSLQGIGSQFADYNPPFVGGYRLMAISKSQTSVGIDEIASSSLRIYPNPFTDKLKIENSVEILNLSIYTISGSCVLNQFPNSGNVELQLSKLAAGTYILKLTTAQGVSTHKIVK